MSQVAHYLIEGHRGAEEDELVLDDVKVTDLGGRRSRGKLFYDVEARPGRTGSREVDDIGRGLQNEVARSKHHGFVGRIHGIERRAQPFPYKAVNRTRDGGVQRIGGKELPIAK